MNSPPHQRDDIVICDMVRRQERVRVYYAALSSYELRKDVKSNHFLVDGPRFGTLEFPPIESSTRVGSETRADRGRSRPKYEL